MTSRSRPGSASERAEQETRAAYEKAARLGLAVVEDLAASPPADVARRGTRRGEGAPRGAGPAGTRRTVEEAVAAGWLVAVPEDVVADAGPAEGPLRGLAVAVKDIIDVAGLPVRNGTPAGLWREPVRSAPVWQRLADAGAHCLGKAATHEMAWGVTTPAIPHPLDPERVAGGSSGGSAACVAAGVSAAGLGTDTGGSIRIPAALCGVVGFRPTTGAVDMRGVTPLAPSQDVAGPLAADVQTCLVMLEVLLGRRLCPEAPRGVAGLRIGVLEDTGPLDDPTAVAYAQTLQRLRRLGARIVACESPAPRWAGSVSLLTMLHESAQLHADTVRADPGSFGGEARALLTLGQRLADQGPTIAAARRSLVAHTARLYDTFDLDAFLTPTTACVAPLRGSPTVVIGSRAAPVAAALTRFTSWASATGMPAISVPVPGTGLPVGVQVMARPWQEAVCGRVATAVQEG